jgi:hypothetical protein
VGATVTALAKKAGRVNAATRDGGAALALLRLSCCFNSSKQHGTLSPALAPQSQLRIDGAEVSVVPVRPAWWPEQWGREEDAPL